MVATKLNWLEQFYYDVFHADKNHFVNSVWQLAVDIYSLMDLSDDFSTQLYKSHNLGNLQVGQSEECIEKICGMGGVREKHSDITGGDRRRLAAVAGCSGLWQPAASGGFSGGQRPVAGTLWPVGVWAGGRAAGSWHLVAICWQRPVASGGLPA